MCTICTLVIEILRNTPGRCDMHLQAAFLMTLQEAAEAYLILLYEDANLSAIFMRQLTRHPAGQKETECVMD